MTVEISVLILAFAAIALVVAWTLFTGSPPTPTSPRVRATMLSALPARLPEGAVYDLGAGWGGLTLALARRYPDRSVVGMETSPLPALVAWLRAARRRNAAIQFGDFLSADLSGAGLVVCYLSAKGLAELGPKLEAELAPSALVLSSTFAVPGWRPLDTFSAGDLYRSPVYLYEIGGPET